MNRTITFPNLVSELSALTSSNDITSDKFIRTLFASITEALVRGESINVPGIGIFSPTYNSSNPIIWTPDEALADTVNEPFACFEPVELGEGVTEELLSSADNEPASEPVATEPETEIPPAPPVPAIPPIPTTVETPVQDDSLSEDIQSEKDDEPIETLPTDDNTASDVQYQDDEEITVRKRSVVNPVIMLLIGLIIGGVAGYLGGRYTAPAIPGAAPAVETVEATDTIADIPDEEPADSVTADTAALITDKVEEITEKPVEVTDTVTRNRYLTTMARQYYGDYRFWVYIYDENIDHLQNPNRIKPGTPIVIPPASKYGIDANDPESVAKAEKRIAEISEKYPL